MVIPRDTYDENVPDFVIELLTQREKFRDYSKIERWISKNPENRKLLDQLTDIWQAGNLSAGLQRYNENNAWQSFKNSLKVPDRDVHKANSFGTGFNRLGRVAAAAAIVSIVLVSAYLIYKYISNGQALVYSEFVVPYGSKSKIALPDGSSVWINAGSRLTYDNWFNVKNRQVLLSGEACFEVANSRLPFTITTGNINIRVLGTKFNVKAYPDEKIVETTVEEGLVEIYNSIAEDAEAKKIILKSNQQAALSLMTFTGKIKTDTLAEEHKAIARHEQIINIDNGLSIQKIKNPEIYSSWKDERWIIESEELHNLARKLERRYNVKVVFEDESLKKYVFSGLLKDETLVQVLEAIRLTAPVGFRLEHNVVSLYEIGVMKSGLRLQKEKD